MEGGPATAGRSGAVSLLAETRLYRVTPIRLVNL